MKRFLTPVLALSTAFVLRAENWPQFRGPTGQGLSEERNLPLKWDATNGIAWKTALPGEGWSSPIVWNDRVFVTSDTDAGVTCSACASPR